MSKEIGMRVQQLRTDTKLNQRDFAARLGISSGGISQIESGKTMPGGDFLLKIHQEFGIDVTWLLTGLSIGGATPLPASIPALTPDEGTLLDNYRRCGVQAKKNLIQTAALLSAGLGGSGVATVAHATGGVSQSNVHGSNHFVAGDSVASMPTKSRRRAA